MKYRIKYSAELLLDDEIVVADTVSAPNNYGGFIMFYKKSRSSYLGDSPVLMISGSRVERVELEK